MKKILFTAFNLDVGGIEKCLVNLVNNMDYSKYDITIMLQVKEGTYLNEINPNVTVVGYNFSKIKNKVLKKIVNILKYLFILIKNYHKYDYSICYASGYIPSSILALFASKKRIGWMHTNILTYMDNYRPYKKLKLNTSQKAKRFLKKIFFRKYDKKIFVSKDALNAYLSIYPKDKDECINIYNFIDYKTVKAKSKDKISLKKDPKVFTFVNVSRHTEFDKRISRIILASVRLYEEGYNFKVLLVGDGEDRSKYEKTTKELRINGVVKFVGQQKNPYPYFLLGDAFVLSSAFEGLPTTCMEALVLGIPVVTTRVSDAQLLFDEKYGIVVDNDDDSLYYGMKQILENNKRFMQFNPDEYNQQILKQIESVLR